ncbi:MAG: primase [Candidatus Parcubacteria bacterium]|jgi:DNA primase
MSSSTVEQIKEKLSVADIIGSYIKLEKAGINFKAKCPFHNEKSPSFFISPSRGNFYCFGCGAKGDIFTFVEKFEGLDFKGALSILASKAGVSLEGSFQEKAKDDHKKELFKALEEATLFFESELKQNIEAREYLLKRGLTEETIREWRIGFAPEEWRILKTHLMKSGFTEDTLLKAGLVKKSEKAEGSYDVFRGRIMFPLFDSSGRAIAFSGRTLKKDDNIPKYLNSPDSVLFNKSEVLYGIHKAKIGIRKKDYAILVEGQMDLLMCHQAGFDNTVATSGTALTPSHIQKLKSLSSKILMIFDGDNAGFKASGRASELALSLGIEVKLGILPEGLDPADLILKDVKMWKSVVSDSKHVIDFHLEHVLRLNLAPRKAIEAVQKMIFPLVAKLESELEKSHFLAKIRDAFGFSEEALWKDLAKVPEKQKGEVKQVIEITESPPQAPESLRDIVFGVLFSEEQKKTEYADKLRIFIEDTIGKGSYDEMRKKAEEAKDSLLFYAERMFPQGLDGVQYADLMSQVRKKFVKAELQRIGLEIKKAEISGDRKKTEELLIRYNSLMKQP